MGCRLIAIRILLDLLNYLSYAQVLITSHDFILFLYFKDVFCTQRLVRRNLLSQCIFCTWGRLPYSDLAIAANFSHIKFLAGPRLKIQKHLEFYLYRAAKALYQGFYHQLHCMTLSLYIMTMPLYMELSFCITIQLLHTILSIRQIKPSRFSGKK